MFSFFYLKAEEDELYFKNILSSTTCLLVSEEYYKVIALYFRVLYTGVVWLTEHI